MEIYRLFVSSLWAIATLERSGSRKICCFAAGFIFLSIFGFSPGFWFILKGGGMGPRLSVAFPFVGHHLEYFTKWTPLYDFQHWAAASFSERFSTSRNLQNFLIAFLKGGSVGTDVKKKKVHYSCPIAFASAMLARQILFILLSLLIFPFITKFDWYIWNICHVKAVKCSRVTYPIIIFHEWKHEPADIMFSCMWYNRMNFS